MRPRRRGGRAVECTGLENRQGRKTFVSSNLTLSAIESAASSLSLAAFEKTPSFKPLRVKFAVFGALR